MRRCPISKGGIGTGGINGAWVIDGLPDWRDHRHTDDGFPEPGVFAASLSDREHGAVSMLFRRLRPGQQPVRNDRVACLAGVLRRRADPARLHHCRCDAAARRSGQSASPASRSRRPLHRRSDRQSADGSRTTTVGRQSSTSILFRAVVMLAALGLRPAPLADAARTASAWRLDRDRADGDRARRFADSARRRYGLRLVRLAIHRQTEHSRSDHADGIHRRRTDGERAAGPTSVCSSGAILPSARWGTSCWASHFTAQPTCCRSTSLPRRGSTPSRSAR